MLHSTVVGGNEMGEAKGTVSAPAEGQQQGAGRGSTGWSMLTEDMKMFGIASTMQDFSKKHTEMVGRFWGAVDKVRHIKNTSGGSGEFVVICWDGKRRCGVYNFHLMLKYNDLFATQNLSDNVIAFMGDRPFEGRPWIFKIPRDKPWE